MKNDLRKAIARRDRIQALSLNIVDSDPFVPIKLAGKDYKLEYSYDAVVEVFRSTGIDINVTEITMRTIGDPHVFPVLLSAGLRTHHADAMAKMDEEGKSVTSLVPMRHLAYVQTCIMLALQATEPEPEEIQRILDETDKEFADDGGQESLPLSDAPGSDGSGHGALTVV